MFDVRQLTRPLVAHEVFLSFELLAAVLARRNDNFRPTSRHLVYWYMFGF
jgi:hypothetical protein